jgi:hypothetical protein
LLEVTLRRRGCFLPNLYFWNKATIIALHVS